jgi:hypothetical protein
MITINQGNKMLKLIELVNEYQTAMLKAAVNGEKNGISQWRDNRKHEEMLYNQEILALYSMQCMLDQIKHNDPFKTVRQRSEDLEGSEQWNFNGDWLEEVSQATGINPYDTQEILDNWHKAMEIPAPTTTDTIYQ